MFDYERDVDRFVPFIRDYFDRLGGQSQIRICVMDYDLPVKTVRQDLLDTVSHAEGIGVVKATLFQYDPEFLLVKTHDAMKSMQLSTRNAGMEAAILDYGRSMRAGCVSRHLGSSLSARDINEATSYLLAKYYYSLDTVVDFMQSSKGDDSNSLPCVFRKTFIQTWVVGEVGHA